MPPGNPPTRFQAPLLRPAKSEDQVPWLFVVLPKAVSETLPRRGRTTVAADLLGHRFQVTLEPDGQLSHWLRISETLAKSAGVQAGDVVELEITPVEEPEPALPPDFREALSASPEAQRMWDATTTIARVDWVHWMTTAKQAKTRAKRIADACDMLASGKKRVCCFDPSGFYSKALCAPQAAE